MPPKRNQRNRCHLAQTNLYALKLHKPIHPHQGSNTVSKKAVAIQLRARRKEFGCSFHQKCGVCPLCGNKFPGKHVPAGPHKYQHAIPSGQNAAKEPQLVEKETQTMLGYNQRGKQVQLFIHRSGETMNLLNLLITDSPPKPRV